jgi:PAS domain S-box-containing protein
VLNQIYQISQTCYDCTVLAAGFLPVKDSVDPVQPLVGRGRWLRVAPFAAIGAVGLLLALTTPPREPVAVVLAGAILVAIVLAVAVLPWSRWPVGWQAAPAMALYVVADLLLFAASEEYAQLLFLTALPMIWLVFFHTRRLLLFGLALLPVALFGPLLLWPDRYSGAVWGTAVMTFLLSCFAGLAGHALVSRSRVVAAEAAAAARRARADHDLLSAYLDTASCLLLVLDREGRVVLYNRYAEQLLGYRATDVIGKPLWQVGDPPEAGMAPFREVLAGRGPVRFEGDSITSAGQRRRIAWSATGLVDDGGTVTHMVSIGVDITGQRAAERLAANVLAAATEQMIAATDQHGRFTVFNVGAERLLGYPSAELVGVHTIDLIHLPEELAVAAAQAGFSSWREMLASPPPADLNLTREWTLVRKDGSRVPVVMSMSSMLEGGEVTGCVLVARDITAERRAAATTLEALRREREAAEQLRQLDKLKTDFIAMVSHDLRTPLTSIVGNTELLLDGDAGEVGSLQRRLLEAVDRNARRLDSLVDDLLLLSRIDSGTLHTGRRPVRLAEVVEGALEAIAAQQASDVEVNVDLPAEPVLVRGDRDQLERVTTNLFGNALKFTPPGGRVDIRVQAGAGDVRLTVSDTGIGIPEADLPHVFDRFFRSSRSQRDNRPGTGLGLTIAKSIVEQHHGSIRVSSNASGGTTFEVTLPRLVTGAGVPAKERA